MIVVLFIDEDDEGKRRHNKRCREEEHNQYTQHTIHDTQHSSADQQFSERPEISYEGTHC